MNGSSRAFEKNVFINCPFDDEYKPIFNAIVFTIEVAGFKTRSSLEASNAATNRLEKITNIISECQYAIHDLSRIELNRKGLPRFNMPLELSIDLGAKRYGTSKLPGKTLLILDKTPHRYQQFTRIRSGFNPCYPWQIFSLPQQDAEFRVAANSFHCGMKFSIHRSNTLSIDYTAYIDRYNRFI
jgi:hypothetical protein